MRGWLLRGGTLRGSGAAAALVYIDFLDELGSGVAPVSAADIRDELDIAYGGIALILLTAPLLTSMVIESPLLLLSDRWRRDRVVAISVALMGVFMIAAAGAQSAWALALALGAWGSVGGLGCAVAQGALMDAYPQSREQWMTRWTLMGSLGDVATPLLIVGVTALGYGWRMGLAVAGALHLLHALILSRVRLDDDDDPDDPSGLQRESGEPLDDSDDSVGSVGSVDPDDPDDPDDLSLWQRLRAGVRDPALMTWLAAGAMCCLLDEILVAFGSMFLRDEFGAGIEIQGFAFLVCALGDTLGLAITDRLLIRVNPLRLLIASSLASVAAYAAWLAAPTIPLSIAALGLLGLVIAPLYPICAARAYATRPGEPGLVAAIDQLYAPVPILAPILVGLVADRVGLLTALALLTVQPVGVAIIGLVRVGRHNE